MKLLNKEQLDRVQEIKDRLLLIDKALTELYEHEYTEAGGEAKDRLKTEQTKLKDEQAEMNK